MRAKVLTGYGDVDKIVDQDIPMPKPEQGQVRIRVRAVGMNPIEGKLRRGELVHMMPLTFPVVLGNEIAGTVDAVGPGVSGLQVGELVVGWSVGGAYAEYALANSNQVLAVPDGLDAVSAVTLPVAGETARRAIGMLDVKKDETVIVNGAAGGVGVIAVQLLVRAGATVIGTASEVNHGFLLKLGAHATTYGDGVVERIRTLAPQGVDAVLDAAGHGFADAAIELRGGTGRIVTLADFAALEKGVTFAMADPADTRATDFEPVLRLAADGHVTTVVAREFGFDEMHEAAAFSDAGHHLGKAVVVV